MSPDVLGIKHPEAFSTGCAGRVSRGCTLETSEDPNLGTADVEGLRSATVAISKIDIKEILTFCHTQGLVLIVP